MGNEKFLSDIRSDEVIFFLVLYFGGPHLLLRERDPADQGADAYPGASPPLSDL